MMIRQKYKYLQNLKLFQPPVVIAEKFKNRNNKLSKILQSNKFMSINETEDQQHISMLLPMTSTPINQEIQINDFINQVAINNRYNTKSTSSLLDNKPT